MGLRYMLKMHARAGRLRPHSTPLGPAETSPRREEITTRTPGRARTKNGRRGLCADADEGSTAAPQVRAGMAAHCKSVGLAFQGSNP